jgi:signal transduction histidine kinase
MSHELRTPLNSIIGFTGIILQGMVGELNDEQRKQLNMVSGSAKHLLGLINDILDISKIATGKVEISPSRFEVAELTQMVEKMVSPMAAEKGLKLGVTVSDGVPSAIYSDNDRIKQVLINLLSNAIKFTESGEIELMVRPSMLASGASPEEFEKEELSGIKADQAASLVFSVSDTGIGIKTESLADVFDEFKQIEGPLTMKAGGTGLGLAISKKLMEMMGGRIWAESEYGKGSCFQFTVPI